MLPLTILVHNTNAISPSSVQSISLTHFLEQVNSDSLQPSFNRHARLPSMLANIFLWCAFIFAIAVLQIEKHKLSAGARIIYGSMMLIIIIVCYVFTLLESKGCTEQILLRKTMQIDMIKRELGSIQKDPKLTNYLSISATNYYNSFTRKYVDYQLYDRSLCQRAQSYFYHQTCLIDTPFHARFCYLNIPDFSIDPIHLCQISFRFHLALVGRDADIVLTDIEQEFQRLQVKLSQSMRTNDTDADSIVQTARIERHIYFQFTDVKQQEFFFGQRRTSLTYDNRTTTRVRWLLTENTFWIMTCLGLSWLFRVLFACLVRRIAVPVYIELEGARPLPTATAYDDGNLTKEKTSKVQRAIPLHSQ